MYICLLCLNVNCFIMFEIHLYLAITSLLILVTLSLFQNFFFYLIFIHFFFRGGWCASDRRDLSASLPFVNFNQIICKFLNEINEILSLSLLI